MAPQASASSSPGGDSWPLGGPPGGLDLEMRSLSFQSADSGSSGGARMPPLGTVNGVSGQNTALLQPTNNASVRHHHPGQLSTKDQRAIFVRSYTQGTLMVQGPSRHQQARRLVMSGPWLALQLTTIIIDVTFIILRMIDDDICLICETDGHVAGKCVAVLINLIFCLDLAIRIYGFGANVFFSHLWNIFDMAIVVITTGAMMLAVSGREIFNFDSAGFLRMLRVIRVLRLLRLTTVCSRLSLTCCSFMRHVTGENKRRFVSLEDDIDLDLVYITPRLISMSVPAAGWLTRLYRNPLPDVVRFFERFHSNRYMIANLCPELPYPSEAFTTGTVRCFDVQDHSPPLLSEMVRFLGMATEWQQKHRENVIAVHCRGGKGRTGSFCCAWLLYSREAEDAEDALNFFTLRRTDMEKQGKTKTQGVETPSQVRYVEYLDRLLREQNAYLPQPVQPPAPVSRRLLRLTSHGLFRPGAPQDLVAVVHEAASRRVLYVSPAGNQVWDLGGTIVREDTRVSVFGRGKLPEGANLQEAYRGLLMNTSPAASQKVKKTTIAGKEPGCLFYFLFHTAMLEGNELCLPLAEVDGAFRKRDLYHESGCLSLAFSN